MILRRWFYFFTVGAFIGLPAAWLSPLLISVDPDLFRAVGAAGASCFFISAAAMGLIFVRMCRRGLC